jgi:hypothetical protein
VSDAEGSAQVGRDLLWVGSFEDEVVDDEQHEGALWDLTGAHKSLVSGYQSPTAAHLERGSRNQQDASLTHLHRMLITPGADFTVQGMVRGTPNSRVTLQISWYPDTVGPSSEQTRVPIEIGEGWTPFRVDVTAPPTSVAAGLYMRLSPPAEGTAAAQFDDLAFIEWASARCTATCKPSSPPPSPCARGGCPSLTNRPTYLGHLP